MSRFVFLTVPLGNTHKSRNKERRMADRRTRNINVGNINALIVGENNEDKALYMTVAVPPLVQERHRYTTVTSKDGARSIRTYDPLGRSKAAFKAAIRQALLDLGVKESPFSGPNAPQDYCHLCRLE